MVERLKNSRIKLVCLRQIYIASRSVLGYYSNQQKASADIAPIAFPRTLF